MVNIGSSGYSINHEEVGLSSKPQEPVSKNAEVQEKKVATVAKKWIKDDSSGEWVREDGTSKIDRPVKRLDPKQLGKGIANAADQRELAAISKSMQKVMGASGQLYQMPLLGKSQNPVARVRMEQFIPANLLPGEPGKPVVILTVGNYLSEVNGKAKQLLGTFEQTVISKQNIFRKAMEAEMKTLIENGNLDSGTALEVQKKRACQNPDVAKLREDFFAAKDAYTAFGEAVNMLCDNTTEMVEQKAETSKSTPVASNSKEVLLEQFRDKKSTGIIEQLQQAKNDRFGNLNEAGKKYTWDLLEKFQSAIAGVPTSIRLAVPIRFEKEGTLSNLQIQLSPKGRELTDEESKAILKAQEQIQKQPDRFIVAKQLDEIAKECGVDSSIFKHNLQPFYSRLDLERSSEFSPLLTTTINEQMDTLPAHQAGVNEKLTTSARPGWAAKEGLENKREVVNRDVVEILGFSEEYTRKTEVKFEAGKLGGYEKPTALVSRWLEDSAPLQQTAVKALFDMNAQVQVPTSWEKNESREVMLERLEKFMGLLPNTFSSWLDELKQADIEIADMKKKMESGKTDSVRLAYEEKLGKLTASREIALVKLQGLLKGVAELEKNQKEIPTEVKLIVAKIEKSYAAVVEAKDPRVAALPTATSTTKSMLQETLRGKVPQLRKDHVAKLASTPLNDAELRTLLEDSWYDTFKLFVGPYDASIKSTQTLALTDLLLLTNDGHEGQYMKSQSGESVHIECFDQARLLAPSVAYTKQDVASHEMKTFIALRSTWLDSPTLNEPIHADLIKKIIDLNPQEINKLLREKGLVISEAELGSKREKLKNNISRQDEIAKLGRLDPNNPQHRKIFEEAMQLKKEVKEIYGYLFEHISEKSLEGLLSRVDLARKYIMSDEEPKTMRGLVKVVMKDVTIIAECLSKIHNRPYFAINIREKDGILSPTSLESTIAQLEKVDPPIPKEELNAVKDAVKRLKEMAVDVSEITECMLSA